jgi:hypothetical protein
VEVNGTPTTAYILANATTIQFNTAPANGSSVRIYRETASAETKATFFPGSAVRAQDLNDNFAQVLYVSQEIATVAENQSTAGLQAQITAATNTANNATVTANAASVTANGIASTANSALSAANSAVSTANNASTNATTAFNTAGAAQITANAAMPKTGGTFTGDISVPSINGGPISGARNRIINGDMRIDQRNGGAAVTIGATAVTYTLDRWAAYSAAASKFSVQRSTIAPSTFSSSALVTSLAATTPGASDGYVLFQKVEGFNWGDLAYGTANARPCTISFWVRSSLTGTFGGVLKNGSEDRNYPYSYTISAANTWEYKTITVAGDTSGTWASDNSTGALLVFDLGSGSSVRGTAGSWQGGVLNGVTGATSVVGTNGATFYITGVQLEAGTVATPFERRSYGQELALCERYLEVCVSGAETQNSAGTGYGGATNFRAIKRVSPTVTRISDVALFNTGITPVVQAQSVNGFITACTVGAVTGGSRYLTTFQASAEL